MRTILVLLVIVGAVGACLREEKSPAAERKEIEYYSAEGEYLFHTAGLPATVTINHREIPGFMAAMAMPFPLEDPSLVEGLRLQPGQAIKFRVAVKKDGYYYVDRIGPVEEEKR